MPAHTGAKKRIFELLAQEPDLANSPKEVAAKLGIPYGAAASSLHDWRKSHSTPIVDTGVAASGPVTAGPIAVEPQPQSQPQALDAVAVAASLLFQVVDFLHQRDELNQRISDLSDEARSWKEQAQYEQRELARCQDENRRILLIHNDQVKKNALVSTEELLRLANRLPRNTV